jgi:hypothetical protein
MGFGGFDLNSFFAYFDKNEGRFLSWKEISGK